MIVRSLIAWFFVLYPPLSQQAADQRDRAPGQGAPQETTECLVAGWMGMNCCVVVCPLAQGSGMINTSRVPSTSVPVQAPPMLLVKTAQKPGAGMMKLARLPMSFGAATLGAQRSEGTTPGCRPVSVDAQSLLCVLLI